MRPLFGGLFIRIMAKYTVAFATLGCRTNQYETDALAEKMKTAGFEVRSFSEKADVYVINTCSVTAEADRKSRQFIRRAKSTNPDAVVIVMGCFSQLNPDKAEELGADYVCGNRNKMSVSDYALKALDGKENKKSDVSVCTVFFSLGKVTSMVFRGRVPKNGAPSCFEGKSSDHCSVG